MKKQRKVKTTDKQRQAIDNIITGKHDKLAPAMRDAGYGKGASRNPGRNLLDRRGVQIYLQKLDKIAQERWNKALPDKVMEVYLDGLSATKLVGKESVEHSDHPTRMNAADRFAKFFGWMGDVAPAGRYQQFNFFSVSEERRQTFNEGFKKLLKQFYSRS